MGPGRLFVSLPSVRAAPREPGARRGAREGLVLPRASVVVRGGMCSEGSSFLVCPPRRTDTETKLPQGSFSRGNCPPETASFQEPRQRVRKDAHGSALVVATGHRWPQGRPFGGVRKSGHRDTLRWRAVGLVRWWRSVTLECRKAREPPRSMRWCQRRCDRRRLGPGSGRLPRGCALLSGRGRDFEVDCPCGWSGAPRRSS